MDSNSSLTKLQTMTTPDPDFRALCADLLDELQYQTSYETNAELQDRARTALATTPPEPPTAIGPEWQPCVKLPITVHVREQRPGETHSSTREGITPLRSDDLIMRGVQGEEYPIGRELFNQTYRMGEALGTTPPEPPTDDTKKALTSALNTLEGWDNFGSWVWPVSAIEQATKNTTESLQLLRAVLERWG